MALLTILKVPDPRLKIKAKPIVAVDDQVRRIMEDMLETMYHTNGIGLAATQVGIDQRIVVIDVGEEKKPEPIRMANPELLWTSDQKATLQEGCLSVPEQWSDVVRPAQVKFRYLDENNEAQEREVSELLAAAIQHEIDHLNGILFLDHLSALKRTIFLKRAIKAGKEQEQKDA